MRWVTARQVERAGFRTTRFRPGYHEDDVDNLLDEVAGTLADMAGYIAELEEHRVKLQEMLAEERKRNEVPAASGSQAGYHQRGAEPDAGRMSVWPRPEPLDGPVAADQRAQLPAPLLEPVLDPRYRELAPEVLASWAPGVPPPGTYSGTTPVSGSAEPGRGHAPIQRGGHGEAGHALGGCDWGDCDGETAGRRWSPDHGWLPVCERHEPIAIPEPRSLADELGQEVEAYVHDEARRGEARRDSATWQTAMDLEHAEWLRRVGMDAPPIEWSTT